MTIDIDDCLIVAAGIDGRVEPGTGRDFPTVKSGYDDFLAALTAQIERFTLTPGIRYAGVGGYGAGPDRP